MAPMIGIFMNAIERVHSEVLQQIKQMDLIPFLLDKWENDLLKNEQKIKDDHAFNIDRLLGLYVQKKKHIHRLKKAFDWGSANETLLSNEISRFINEAKIARADYYREKLINQNHELDCYCRGCNAIYGHIPRRAETINSDSSF
jgi:hypothetical protein